MRMKKTFHLAQMLQPEEMTDYLEAAVKIQSLVQRRA